MASSFAFALLLCLASGLLSAEAGSGWDKKKDGRCQAKCPPGWIEYASRCYSYYNNDKSWSDAEHACKSYGGNLASFQSSRDHDYLRKYMYRVSSKNALVWIGGHDSIVEGKFVWSDGKKFHYSNFHNKLVRNPKHNCVEMNYNGYYWNDNSCSTLHPYLCSRDLPCSH